MVKRYLCIGYWVDKETGAFVSKLAEISEGIGKTKNPYGIVDIDNVEMEGEKFCIGEIIEYDMKRKPTESGTGK